MAYSNKTFRKAGSHYSELAAIDGVEVKIGERFRPPRKITLPVGFHPKDPTDVLSLTYDFALENEIIAKAVQEREKIELKKKQKQQEEEAAAALKSQTEPSKGDASNPVSIFSHVGTDILQPIAVPSSAHKRNDSLGKNTFDLSDFESNGTNPFELVELQTINDLDVLKSVLDPISTATSNMSSSSPVDVDSSAVSRPSSLVSSQLPASSKSLNYNLSNQNQPAISNTENHNLNSRLSKSVPDLCNDPLVDISSGDHRLIPDTAAATSRSVSPPVAMGCLSQPNACVSMGYGMPSQPYNYLQGLRNSSSHSVNSTHTTETITPLDVKTSISNPLYGTPSPSNNRLPPLRKPPPVPPRIVGRKNVNSLESVNTSLQGLTVTDGVTTNTCKPTLPSTSQDFSPRNPSNHSMRNNEVAIASNPSVIKRQPAQRRSTSSLDTIIRHSTPLPPITPPPNISPPNSTNQAPSSGPQSLLPDPTPVLSTSEKNLVQYIAAMGFPTPRVARAVQRLGGKDREVVDFLVAVEELCQKGFSGDNAEIALTLNNDDSNKASKFLDLTKTFKELGFEELHIHEALRAADNDRDKALDFLASISAS